MPGATTATIRDRLINVPARLARSARCLTLHLPERWPWSKDFTQLFSTVHAPLPPGAPCEACPKGPETCGQSGRAGQTSGHPMPESEAQPQHGLHDPETIKRDSSRWNRAQISWGL